MASHGAPVGIAPVRLSIRMYQVGFGDCFLLTFEYDRDLDDGRRVRHILVDFGSTSLAAGQKDLLPVARRIGEHTQRQLDVVVVSHRHKDHLSAFGSSAIASAIAGPGFPRLVVRSWTERPAAARDAHGLAGAADQPGPAVGRRSRAYLRTLARAEEFAGRLATTVAGAPARSLGGEVLAAARDQLANQDAVDQLAAWATVGRSAYLHYGMASGIEDVVPGLGVRVLGPPTIDQHEDVAAQRSRDADEFWMLYQGLLADLRPEDLLGRGRGRSAAEPDGALDTGGGIDPAALEAPRPLRPLGPVGPVRWLTDRMGRQQLGSLLRIVRILDTALNNTSLILLFEVETADGPLRMLFPGDAQIENWEYALRVGPDAKDNLDLLRTVDLYKVGHHGSRNATPRTLYNLWTEPETEARPMVSLMSTKCGVHGRTPATAVPRKTLMAALDTRTKLYQTRALTGSDAFFELRADLTAGRRFTRVVGPETPPDPCRL